MIQNGTVLLGIRVLVLIALILAAGLLPEPRAYPEAIARGHALREATEYRAALDAYRTAYTMRPGAVLPRLWEAQTDVVLGREGDALYLYRQIATEKGPTPDILIGWGQAYYALGDSERAMPLWQQALELGATEAHYYLGLAHLSRGDWSEAATHFGASLSADGAGSHSQAASYWLGVIHTLDDPTWAREYLGMATQGSDPALTANAQMLIRALEQPAPKGQNRTTLLGATLFGLGHWKLAQAHLEQALLASPDDNEALAYLGATLDRQGDVLGAESYLREALDLDPNHLLSLYFWGRHQFGQGAVLPARGAFVHLLAHDPRNAAACAEIGRTYTVEGKYALAEEWFEAALEHAPDQTDFYMILAEFESETLFNLDRGLEAAQNAVAIAPDDPRAYDLLGWMLYLSRQWPEAETALHRAIALEPYLVSAYYHLGKLYESQRRFAPARWAFGRAVDLGAGSSSQILAEDALRLLGDGPETNPTDDTQKGADVAGRY